MARYLAGWATLLVLVVVLLTPVSSARSIGEPLAAPAVFRVSATNGYTLSVISGQDPRKNGGLVLLAVRSPGASAYYSVPAAVTATSIEADLGSVGRIAVDYVPSGGTRTERPPCTKKDVSFEAGNYVGTIDFYGEDGYSEAHATSVPGLIKPALSFLCGGGPASEGSGGHSPGALLTVHGDGNPKIDFGAMKNSPTRPARFSAEVEEHRGALDIFREVTAVAGPSAFDFNVSDGFGRVGPPAPFSGKATYRKRGKQTSWKGNLAVDFPGHSGFKLTGPGIHAGMHRAVLNPSHPFRVH